MESRKTIHFHTPLERIYDFQYVKYCIDTIFLNCIFQLTGLFSYLTGSFIYNLNVLVVIVYAFHCNKLGM